MGKDITKVDNRHKILVGLPDIDYSLKLAESLENIGFDVSIVNTARDIIRKVEACGIDYCMMGLSLEETGLKDIVKLNIFLEQSGISPKLFAITRSKEGEDRMLSEKMRVFNPKGIIDRSFSSDEIAFKLNNIVYEDKGNRKNCRGLVKTTVYCDYKQHMFTAESFTLSRDGIFLKSQRRFNKDSNIFLDFKLPGRDENFSTMGNILYSINDATPKPRISPKGMGVYFIDLDQPSRKLIDEYVRSGIS